MESALSKQARIPQQRLKCHSTALIACTSGILCVLCADLCAISPTLIRSMWRGLMSPIFVRRFICLRDS
jgi:hypothetical protein